MLIKQLIRFNHVNPPFLWTFSKPGISDMLFSMRKDEKDEKDGEEEEDEEDDEEEGRKAGN